MAGEQPLRRMTLRQLLAHTEKCARDLHDRIFVELLAELSDFRDLTRPVRRRSQYPKLLAVQNALRKVAETQDDVQGLTRELEDCLHHIREHAKRESIDRL